MEPSETIDSRFYLFDSALIYCRVHFNWVRREPLARPLDSLLARTPWRSQRAHFTLSVCSNTSEQLANESSRVSHQFILLLRHGEKENKVGKSFCPNFSRFSGKPTLSFSPFGPYSDAFQFWANDKEGRNSFFQGGNRLGESSAITLISEM